ncbi:MAG TPA: transaldolase [Dehalococcoidia bacterium]|nr:transaldolase [Dehalococcoidia bacterium]
MANAVVELYQKERQSPWLDYIRRNMLEDGGLTRYVEQDGIRGVTANPTIFEKAIGAGDDYDEQITELVKKGTEPRNLFEQLAITDIRHACDILRPVFDEDRSDGFVSIEVSPEKAFETQATIDEAKRWWREIDRPNLMVKIPATTEGVPAIEECIASGVNINITLLFAIEFYEQVMDAYLKGLERRVAAGQDVKDSNSVASFFVSRVDTNADKRIEAKLAAAKSDAERAKLESLLGKVAIANAKVAYHRFREIFSSERFKKLEGAGAKLQRPLWASTSTKNPKYNDIMYVQDLIGPDTVNTLPPATIEAFKDHGVARKTIDEDYDGAVRVLSDLEDVGISLKEITDELQHDGVDAFSKSFDIITETTAAKAAKIREKAGAR